MVSPLGKTAVIPTALAIFFEIKLDSERKIKRAQEEYNIPDDLVINFNQTPLVYIYGSNRTMEFEAATSVLIIEKGKKYTLFL